MLFKGMYYLRSRPAADPIKFTLDVEALLKDGGKIDVGSHGEQNLKRKQSEVPANDKENIPLPQKKVKTIECTDEICTSCGS